MAKVPIEPVRWQPPGVRALTLNPQPLPPLNVVALPGHGPEDVVADAGGNIWTGLVDGRIVRISPDGTGQRIVATTEHRPLGMHVARDGRILICCRDKLLALDPDTGGLEPLVSRVDGPQMLFCSNVTESSDGTIYFTESTNRFGFENFKAAAMEGRQTGRLFRRDTDGSVTTLATGLEFANGVALTADESALIVAESMARRINRYALTGPAAGRLEPILAEIPGLPDNISTGPDGRIWIAMVDDRNRLLEFLLPRPPGLRRRLWRLPDAMLPNLDGDPWVIAIDPNTGTVLANMRADSALLRAVTGVVESGGRLWLGCIGSSAVGYVELADAPPQPNGRVATA